MTQHTDSMQTNRTATLMLDDGTVFRGYSFGYERPVAGEVVFNTAMTGYPESLTDPSYAGQLMVLTYPLVGNYGVPPCTFEPNGIATFMESEKIHAEAIIVSDYSHEYSHWNAECSLGDWLKEEKILLSLPADLLFLLPKTSVWLIRMHYFLPTPVLRH